MQQQTAVRFACFDPIFSSVQADTPSESYKV
jgi:hypothetical protein